MWRFVLVLVFLIFLPALASAQETGTLTGLVMDEAEDPVSGLNVVVTSTMFGDATGGKGAFRIEGVPAGEQTIRISGIGYDERSQVVTVRAGRTTHVTLTISEAVLSLDEIEITGQRETFKQAYLASKSSLEVDEETVQDFNAANSYDALRILPGVSYLAGAGGRNGKPSRIRGGSAWTIPDVIGDFPSLRAAGIGAEDGGLTADLGSSIPAVALESITVNKGSLGVLYGEGADGGVIVNEIQRGRPGEPTGTLFAEVNPIAEQLYMGDLGGGTETFDYYVAAKLLNGDYQDMLDAQGRNLKTDHFFSGLAKLGYNPQSNMRLELLALNGQDQINYDQTISDDPETDVDESQSLPPNEFETTNTNQVYGLTFDHTLSDAFGYEAGYNHYYTKAFRFSLKEDAAHRNRPQRSHTFFGNAYFNKSLADGIGLNSKAGVESVSHLQEENAQNSEKRQRFVDHSAYLANTFSFADRLFINVGTRYTYAWDDYDEYRFLVYDAGLAYDIAPTNTRVRASYSTGYARNKGFAYFFGPIEEAGGVKPTENRTVEAGVDQRYVLFSESNPGVLRLTAFRTKNEGVPNFSGWGAQTVYYENRTVQGIEAWLDQYVQQQFRLFGSFTYLKSEIESTTHPEGINVGNTGVRVPRYTAAAGLSVHPADDVSLSLIGTYDDGMRSKTINQQTGEVTITTHASYTRLNFASSYAITDRVAVQLRIENVLNQEDLGASYEVISPEGYSYTETSADNPGRFISLGVTMNY